MECLKNCSCTAYANSNFNGSCLMWLGDLIDNRELTSEKSGYSVAWCVQVTDTWGVAHFFMRFNFHMLVRECLV